jgi:hypothetical protein
VVGRSYAHIGLGAGLLDWATDVARRHYKLTRIRIDVWTTNAELHAYYEGQGFTRSESRDPGELGDYPSQALFERDVRRPGSDYTKLFSEEGLDDRRFR